MDTEGQMITFSQRLITAKKQGILSPSQTV